MRRGVLTLVRTPPERTDPSTSKNRDRLPDVELFPVLAILWVVSAIRVGGGLARHETFGAEATLAALMLLLVPFLVADTLAAFGRRMARKVRMLTSR